MKFPYLLSLSLLSTSVALRCVARFNLDLTWEIGAPDGVKRWMVFINKQFPGPTLSITEGDDVEITVQNNLPFGTAIHAHGIEQQGSPWSDGVPGLSQMLIPSGGNFTYKWAATQYGTYWYHAHSRGQAMDGLYGAIYVAPSPNTKMPWALISDSTVAQAAMQKAFENPQMIMFSDWTHMTSEEIRDVTVSANIDPFCTDSILINGKGSVNCQSPSFIQSLIPPPVLEMIGSGLPYSAKGCAPLESNILQTNTTHFLDLVPQSMWEVCTATSTSSEVIIVDSKNGWASLNFISGAPLLELTASIDAHQMWIYAVDGLFINPQLVELATFPQGTRYSAMVQLNQIPGNYTLRVASSGINQKVSGYGYISYDGVSEPPVNVQPYIDYGGSKTMGNVTTFNSTIATPLVPNAPSPTVDATHFLALNKVHDAYLWAINGSSFGPPLELGTPLLFDPASAISGLYISSKNSTWVDLILTLSGLQPPHPIHKHSNKMYLIGQGIGPFNWSSTAEAMVAQPDSFNLIDPPIVDTVYTPGTLGTGSWLVVRYQVVNPGVFFLHCHINPHLEGGMGIALLDGLEDLPHIPSEYQILNNTVVEP